MLDVVIFAFIMLVFGTLFVSLVEPGGNIVLDIAAFSLLGVCSVAGGLAVLYFLTPGLWQGWFGFIMCVVAGACGGVYALPAAIAKSKRRRNWVAISVLNLFLGMTFVGWVIALVWACMEDR